MIASFKERLEFLKRSIERLSGIVRVLAVPNGDNALNALYQALDEFECAVAIVRDPATLKTQIEEQQPDVLIVPASIGSEALGGIPPSIETIMVNDSPDPDARSKALASGAKLFVEKSELKNVLSTILKPKLKPNEPR